HSVSPFGDARWAKEGDIRRAGLRATTGLLLGRSNGQFLVAGGFEHNVCFAPTRSGKGVGLVIPNLLNWAGSAIVHDIKAENWSKTSGWRQQAGSLCIRFDPTYHHEGEGARSCARYNPLLEIRDHPNDVRDAQ